MEKYDVTLKFQLAETVNADGLKEWKLCPEYERLSIIGIFAADAQDSKGNRPGESALHAKV